MDRIKGYGYAEVMRLRGHAHETADVDILNAAKYLRVTPTDPQTLVWMVPGNDIVYNIATNTTWEIK